MSSILSYNEKLLKEKEVLSEELKSCADKVVGTIEFPFIVQGMPQQAFVSLWVAVPEPPALVQSYRWSYVILD
jgi:hypothetical protein